MNKPMIRFEGYEEDWENVKLGDVLEIVSGFSFKSDSYRDEGVPIIRISNLDGNGVDISNNIKYTDEFDIGDRYILNRGDLLIAMSGATAGGLGIYCSDELAYLNQRVGKFEPDSDLLSEVFLYSLVNSSIFKTGLDSLLVAGAQPNISSKDICSIKLNKPELEEQEQIGNFFKTLDDLISAEEEQLQNYEQYKSAMLQKMFPEKGKNFPDLRFNGFDEDWEEKKLGKLVDSGEIILGRGNVLSKKSMDDSNGEYPVYSSSGMNNGLMGHYDEYMFDQEMITWSIDGGGFLYYRPKHKFSITNVSGYMILDDDLYDYKFMHEMLDLQRKRIPFDYQLKAHPSSIRTLYDIYKPSLKEQEQIGDFFKTLDELIDKKQERIEQLKETKEAFLQKMFI